MITCSIILTTYNRPDALALVLSTLAEQKQAPDEVLIADDGSGSETRRCIAYWQEKTPFPVHHMWQPDVGFRAAAARNRAIARSSGNYLIFMDGDCLAFSDFVQRHLQLAEPGWFLVGNRMLLDQSLTQRIVMGLENPLAWSPMRWLRARKCGESNRLAPLLRLPNGPWRKCRRQRWQGARTCNLGVWRQDVVAINGFDERYAGWGHEDADLVVRLLHLGRKRKDGQFAVPVVHLWHGANDRSNELKNNARLRDLIEDTTVTRAVRGLDQYADTCPPMG